jgi:hypothetical protein
LDWIKSLVEKILTQSWGAVMTVFVVTTVLTLSNDARQWLGLGSFYAQYRPWVSIIWLSACARILWHGCAVVFFRIRAYKRDSAYKNEVSKSFSSLSPSELHILENFKGESVQWVSLENPVVTGLCRKGILLAAASPVSTLREDACGGTGNSEFQQACQLQINPLIQSKI